MLTPGEVLTAIQDQTHRLRASGKTPAQIKMREGEWILIVEELAASADPGELIIASNAPGSRSINGLPVDFWHGEVTVLSTQDVVGGE